MESDIPSPELFPIHYLDELEFFPGDYVVDAKGKLKSLILFCSLYLLVINIHKDIFLMLTFVSHEQPVYKNKIQALQKLRSHLRCLPKNQFI